AGKALLAHPFILHAVEKLQGRNFIPTWDTIVFKAAGKGAATPWHRDAGMDFYDDEHYKTPIFNVDFYLDEADLSNCVRGIPGSNQWSETQAKQTIIRLNNEGYDPSEAVPILMRPGDVLFHNILTLHGSPPCDSPLRRVIYYEFRPGELEREKGPHIPEYVPTKQRVLLACLRDRNQASYIDDAASFEYNPENDFAPPSLDNGEILETYRYPHKQYWRRKST
ncbi:MAG: phytanoyl-CoA dioxygenase family protein, partial [Pseudomonadota bacterium]